MKLPCKNSLEWAVFGASLILVLAVLAYLAVAALTLGDRSPNLEIELGKSFQQTANDPNLFLVPVTVHNRGDRTAEDVQIEVALEKEGQAVETASLSLPQVPFRSARAGMVAFTRNPGQGRLVARVLGFTIP